MTGSPSNPPRSGESESKSGVRLTIEEHLDRIEAALRISMRSTTAYTEALESLAAVRAFMEDL